MSNAIFVVYLWFKFNWRMPCIFLTILYTCGLQIYFSGMTQFSRGAVGAGGAEVLPQGSEGSGEHGTLALLLLGEPCIYLTGVLGWYVCFIWYKDFVPKKRNLETTSCPSWLPFVSPDPLPVFPHSALSPWRLVDISGLSCLAASQELLGDWRWGEWDSSL